MSHLVHEGCWFEVTPVNGAWDITVKDDGNAARLFPPNAQLRLDKPTRARQ